MKLKNKLAGLLSLSLLLGVLTVSSSAIDRENDVEFVLEKRAYKELTSIDYYEINNQFLEISYPEIDSEFLYGFEYGNPETRNNGNGEIYLTKCFQISKNCIEKFGLEVKDGNTFSDDDMKYVSGKYIPVIVGSDYADTLKVGDLLKGVYIQDEFTYEVIGVLSKGANINLGGHEVSLDRYLVMPSFDIEEDPINAEDDMFQVRHYANKLSGKLQYDSFMQFLEFYKRIFDINGTFKTEGKVVFQIMQMIYFTFKYNADNVIVA